MRKKEELTHPGSCMSKAALLEMLFVLLGRDPAAPATVRFWAQERVRLGKNIESDTQIREALQCANAMEVDYLLALKIQNHEDSLHLSLHDKRFGELIDINFREDVREGGPCVVDSTWEARNKENIKIFRGE